jgi:hypothetical protein
MRRTTRSIITTGALLAIGAGPAIVSAQQPAAPAPPPGTYQAREDNQQDRIANGMQSGQLTAGESKHLEGDEHSLNQERAADRASDDGHLTSADRSQLNQQQNQVSHQIYQDKHNAAVAHYGNTPVGQRRENQQDRIAQGVRSGSLNPNEASHLEGREQHINQQVRTDRSANGGTLNGQQRAQITREQNRASGRIYADKHNAARNP